MARNYNPPFIIIDEPPVSFSQELYARIMSKQIMPYNLGNAVRETKTMKNETCKPAPEKELKIVFNDLVNNIDRSLGLTKDLRSVLDPLLVPEPPVNEEEVVNESFAAPFAHDIALQVDNIKMLNRYLSDLLDRVQI